MAGHTDDLQTALAGLEDTDHAVRAAALRSLERLGALNAATLLRATGDPGVPVRLTAIELAASRPEIDVTNLLEDHDESVVEQAAWCCGERPDDHRPVAGLVKLAREHTNPLVREAAVASLGALGSPDGRSTILGAMHDKPAIRRRAVIAMAGLDGPDITEAIDHARHDRDRQVRDTVADLWGPEID